MTTTALEMALAYRRCVRAANGDSNDTEIERLQAAIDTARDGRALPPYLVTQITETEFLGLGDSDDDEIGALWDTLNMLMGEFWPGVDRDKIRETESDRD